MEAYEAAVAAFDEYAEREAVVAEARSWIGTPFHHKGDIKRVGVDCGMILVRVFEAACGITIPDPRPYPRHHHLHRSDERYIALLQPFAREIPAGSQLPGDIMLWRYGRTFSHAGIIARWPNVVHAYWPSGIVEESDVSLDGPLSSEKYPRRFFSHWGR